MIATIIPYGVCSVFSCLPFTFNTMADFNNDDNNGNNDDKNQNDNDNNNNKNNNEQNNNDKIETEEEKSENKENNDEFVTSFENNDLYDRAYGLCIGAAIGDSIGSYCEFRNFAIEDNELEEAMTMPGGGTWGTQVITGQVTDDTELAISLSYGLCQIIKSESKKFDLKLIANEYNKWNESGPFDRGFCTRAVLFFAPNVVQMKKKAISYDLEKKNQYKSEGNLANGALMRCMPLILYGYNLNYDNLYILMKLDAGLTHANYYIFLINTCYAIMVLYLLKCDKNEKNKNKNAYNEMIAWLIQQTENKGKSRNEIARYEAAKIILQDWLKPVNGNDLKQLQTATKFKGFVKIAFQRCCFHLLHNNSYSDAIKQTVGEGGDTDTNACIVGGLIGSLYGLKGIPKKYIENIHECNPTKQIRDRFQAKWYFKNKMVETILKHAPTNEIFEKNIVSYPMS